ncbi:MAG: hypothetical protein RLZZ508_62 [Actinomycetota bacterium]|jgi:beta-glucosidase
MSDFKWGVATAAFQIEGAANEDGRAPSIWDKFCEVPGNIRNGDNGLVACDHYHRYKEDVEIMDWIGVNAYRFSVSWSRVLPNGIGEVNPAGIAFYSNLVDELLAKGIEPFLTIYHWDLPQALQEKGGWLNREAADWFAYYTEVLVANLGDRVKNWITINEPHCICWFGFLKGWFAPGVQDLNSAVTAAHHVLLAHGRAVRVINKLLPEAKVGIAPGLTPCVPATQSPEDIAAAARQDGYDIRWFMDPVYGKGYPKDIVEIFGITPPILDDDMEVISTPTDFLGVNFYLRSVIADDPDGEFLKIKGIDPADSKYTGMGWEICAPAFKDLLVRIKNDYSPKEIFITENGSAWDDVVQADGSINDVDRIEYLELHLEQMRKAISEGVPVKGYFAWSFMDNFEWTFGYEKRFGLVHVDYDTLKRTPKASAHRYREIIRVANQ